MGRKNGFKSISDNMRSYHYYLKRFSELSIAMFEWSGLPDTVDPRYIELALFEEGTAVWFDDEVVGQLCLSVSYAGSFNPYGYPNRRVAYSRYSSYRKELTAKDSVLIYNNMMRTNTFPTMEFFARKLWNLDRIVDVNANAQKTPLLIQCPENLKLTAKQIYEQYDGNEPVIFSYKGIDIGVDDLIRVMKTDAPYVADKIYELKCNIFNEALTYLGIPNSIVQKKERQLADEVHRDLGGTMASRYSRLIARERGCELIRKMFGGNPNVKYRDEEASRSAVEDGMNDIQENSFRRISGGEDIE